MYKVINHKYLRQFDKQFYIMYWKRENKIRNKLIKKWKKRIFFHSNFFFLLISTVKIFRLSMWICARLGPIVNGLRTLSNESINHNNRKKNVGKNT